MGYNPVTIEEFPGLDMRADPGDARAAIDAQNVMFDPGRVRVRDGQLPFFTTSAMPMFAQMARTAHLIIVATGAPANVYAVGLTGTLAASTTMTVVGIGGASGVSIGTTAGSFFYITNGSSAVKRWDGTTWTSPAGFPANTDLLTISPTDNRLMALVQAGSKVNFSDQGAPETFTAGNFVQLAPGDGENLCGATVFANQTFVFKKTKFYVFYGTNDNPAAPGTPLFNYRAVDTGIGMFGAQPGAVCTAPDGVYFVGNDGVYKTTGGPPVKISAPLDPFFNQTVSFPSAYWLGGAWDYTQVLTRICYVSGRLYLSLSTSSSTGVVFVYELQSGKWTMWNLYTGALAAFTPNFLTTPPLLAMGDGTTHMMTMSAAVSSDSFAGAIVSRYRLPFETYGSAGEKRLRETILEGSGTPTVKWSRDWGALGTGSAVALGAWPSTLGVNRQRLAQRGRAFSLQLSATSGAWIVNRIQVNLDGAIRPASVTV